MVNGAATFVCDVILKMPKIKAPSTLSTSDLILGKDFYSAMKDGVVVDLTLVCGETRFACNKVICTAISIIFHQHCIIHQTGPVSGIAKYFFSSEHAF